MVAVVQLRPNGRHHSSVSANRKSETSTAIPGLSIRVLFFYLSLSLSDDDGATGEWMVICGTPAFPLCEKIQFNSSTCSCVCLSNLLVLCEESKTGVDPGRERSFFCWHCCCCGCLNDDKEVGWDFVAKMISKYIPKKSAFTLCNEKTIYSSLVPPHPFAEEISYVVAWKLLLISFWLNTRTLIEPLFLSPLCLIKGSWFLRSFILRLILRWSYRQVLERFGRHESMINTFMFILRGHTLGKDGTRPESDGGFAAILLLLLLPASA